MTDGLTDLAGIQTTVTTGEKTAVAPEVVVAIESDQTETSATTIVGALPRENPRVFVGADKLPRDEVTINPNVSNGR